MEMLYQMFILVARMGMGIVLNWLLTILDPVLSMGRLGLGVSKSQNQGISQLFGNNN